MVKVSVVIPIYNVENYLEDCLDSIVNQTLKDIEIICVNDGSTDNSLDIINKYAEKDNRMIVISQENGGHAVATNRGMGMAKGKYLYLMDSDDIVKLNTLEDTYNLAEDKNLDFVIFKAINYNDPEKRFYETEVYSMGNLAKAVGNKVFNYKDIPDNVLFNMSVTPWSKLYNREFVEKIGAKFPEGLVFEDNVFFWQVLFNAERIYFHDEFLFTRRWYSTSSTTAGDKRFLDSIKVYNLVWEEFRKHDEFENHKSTLYNKKVTIGNMRFSKIKPEFKNIYFDAWKEDILKIFKDKEFYLDFFNNLTYKNKKIIEQLLISDSGFEFEMLRKSYNLYHTNKHLSSEILKLEHEINLLKKSNKDKLAENNWVVTDFLKKQF